MFKLTRISVALLVVLCLSACKSAPEELNPNDTPEQLYAAAKYELTAGAYELAIKAFEQLEARFPYGRYAQQAQLEIAYTYYKQRESAQALAACDRFLKRYPNHPSVDYAYYIKGLALINEDRGWTTYLNTQDLSQRDAKELQEAYDAFNTIATRFPKSRYASDSIKRMNVLWDALAQHELNVAQYYLNRRAPLAAANRAQSLILKYPGTPANEQALAIMMAAYGQMGLKDLQNDAKRVLELNYPKSKYLAPKKK